MAERTKRPPSEAMVDLRRRLSLLAVRDPGRAEIMARMADAYGVSVWTIYRALRELSQPKSVRRADHGRVRIAPQEEMERYAEIVVALKIRTANKKGEVVRFFRQVGGPNKLPDWVLRRQFGFQIRGGMPPLI